MKKIISLLLVGLSLFGVSACSFQSQGTNSSNSNAGNNSTSTNEENRTMKRYYIDAEYNSELNTVSINANGFVLPSNMELVSKQNKKKISNYIVGDYLEVYYSDTDNTVNEVIVDEADVLAISVTKLSIPGEQRGTGKIDLISDDSHIQINHYAVPYVINYDGSITDKEDVVDNTTLYGVYRKEDIVITDLHLNYSLYYLVGLYSFLPRSK